MLTACPYCQSRYTVPDAPEPCRFQCSNPACGQVFAAPAAEPVPVPVAPLRAPAPVPVVAPVRPAFAAPEQAWAAPAVARPGAMARWSEALRSPNAVQYAAVTLGTAATVVVVGLLWTLIRGTGTGLPAWANDFVPNDAILVGYVNMERLQTQLPESLRGGAVPQAGLRAMGVKLAASDLAETLVVATDLRRPIVVLRTIEDQELGRLAGLGGDKKSAYLDVEYLAIGPLFVAKMAERTFCAAPSEELLKRSIDQWEQHAPPALDADFRKVLRRAARGEHYVAFRAASAEADQAGPAIGLSLSIDSRLRLDAHILFATRAEAQDRSAQTEQALQDLPPHLASWPEPMRKLAIEMADSLEIGQSGRAMHVFGTWEIDALQEDLQAIVKDAALPEMLRVWGSGAGPAAEGTQASGS